MLRASSRAVRETMDVQLYDEELVQLHTITKDKKMPIAIGYDFAQQACMFKNDSCDVRDLLVTTESVPRILLQTHASYCTLLTAADKRGNAVMLHSNLATRMPKEIDTTLQEYANAVKSVTDETREGILSATQSTLRWDTVNERLVGHILKALTSVVPLYPIVVDEEAKKAKYFYMGMLFVPRQHAIDDRNKLLLIPRPYDDARARNIFKRLEEFIRRKTGS